MTTAQAIQACGKAERLIRTGRTAESVVLLSQLVSENPCVCSSGSAAYPSPPAWSLLYMLRVDRREFGLLADELDAVLDRAGPLLSVLVHAALTAFLADRVEDARQYVATVARSLGDPINEEAGTGGRPSRWALDLFVGAELSVALGEFGIVAPLIECARRYDPELVHQLAPEVVLARMELAGGHPERSLDAFDRLLHDRGADGSTLCGRAHSLIADAETPNDLLNGAVWAALGSSHGHAAWGLLVRALWSQRVGPIDDARRYAAAVLALPGALQAADPISIAEARSLLELT